MFSTQKDWLNMAKIALFLAFTSLILTSTMLCESPRFLSTQKDYSKAFQTLKYI